MDKGGRAALASAPGSQASLTAGSQVLWCDYHLVRPAALAPFWWELAELAEHTWPAGRTVERSRLRHGFGEGPHRGRLVLPFAQNLVLQHVVVLTPKALRTPKRERSGHGHVRRVLCGKQVAA